MKHGKIRFAEDGEALVRAPGVFSGYPHDPGRTREALTPYGWYHTGDLGKWGEEGNRRRHIDLAKRLVHYCAMVEVGMHEAKTNLSELVRRAMEGEEVTITRSGEPVVRLVPAQRRTQRTLGRDEGQFEVPEDFDAPLPEDILRAFEQ